jgi:hypothetical protein
VDFIEARVKRGTQQTIVHELVAHDPLDREHARLDLTQTFFGWPLICSSNNATRSVDWGFTNSHLRSLPNAAGKITRMQCVQSMFPGGELCGIDSYNCADKKRNCDRAV